jgi:hypothetical protein
MKFLKIYLLLIITSIAGSSYSQKYALLDKNMIAPFTYSNSVSLQHSYQNLFPVEKDKLSVFVTELEKIVKELNDKKIPNSYEFNIGATNFKMLKIPLQNEERMDLMLTTTADKASVNMHLVDGKNSNVTNAYYVSTWLRYLKKEMSVKEKYKEKYKEK